MTTSVVAVVVTTEAVSVEATSVATTGVKRIRSCNLLPIGDEEPGLNERRRHGRVTPFSLALAPLPFESLASASASSQRGIWPPRPA